MKLVAVVWSGRENPCRLLTWGSTTARLPLHDVRGTWAGLAPISFFSEATGLGSYVNRPEVAWRAYLKGGERKNVGWGRMSVKRMRG